MSEKLKIAVSGIGGYGDIYLRALLDDPAAAAVEFVGAVDPFPAACKRLHELQARAIPVFPTMDALYADRAVDLMVLASPIQFHAEQTEYAVAHGSHVLCEKPLAGSLQDIDRMRQARVKAARSVAIGYQWSYCPNMRRLYADVRSGQFGKLVNMKAMALWPRDARYYNRNSWAGKVHDSAGRPVLDSPMNNACAHFLHNMLEVARESAGRIVHARSLSAEVNRANPIENYDTVVVRCETDCDVPLLFIASHSVRHVAGPELHYTFERGTVTLGEATRGHLIFTAHDGDAIDYGQPAGSTEGQKLWSTAEAIRHSAPPLCSIEDAEPHTRIVCAAQAAVEIRNFPASSVQTHGGEERPRRWVTGLDESLRRCFEQFVLPAELGLNLSQPDAAAGLRRSLTIESSDASLAGIK